MPFAFRGWRAVLSAAAMLSVAGLGVALPVRAQLQKEIFSIGGGAFPQDHIYRVDLNTNAVTDLGYSGVVTPTNLAMTADRTLYYMNPCDINGHMLYKASLNAVNTALVGAPTLVAALPTQGFGIIDGFTAGPSGKDIYMTGYGKK